MAEVLISKGAGKGAGRQKLFLVGQGAAQCQARHRGHSRPSRRHEAQLVIGMIAGHEKASPGKIEALLRDRIKACQQSAEAALAGRRSLRPSRSSSDTSNPPISRGRRIKSEAVKLFTL